MNRRSLGTQYEALAAYFLEREGYEILERNFRCRNGEIDIVAKEGDYLCFVEVKYRKNSRSGDALEAVTPLKQQRIIRTAEVYLSARGIDSEHKCRFDAVGIMPGKIRLVRNAFGLR